MSKMKMGLLDLSAHAVPTWVGDTGLYPDFAGTCRAHLWAHCGVDSVDQLKNPKRNAIGENVQGTTIPCAAPQNMSNGEQAF